MPRPVLRDLAAALTGVVLATFAVLPSTARAESLGIGEASGAVGNAPLPREERHRLRQAEALDHGYAVSLEVDHLPRGDGAGLSLQSPSSDLGLGIHLHGDFGYDTLLFPSLDNTDGSRTASGFGLLGAAGSFVWHGSPAQDVLPYVNVGAVAALASRRGVTSRPRSVGARAALGVEVPLAFGRVAEGPAVETGASLVAQYSALLGLAKADELPGRPDPYAGGLVAVGLRFYL